MELINNLPKDIVEDISKLLDECILEKKNILFNKEVNAKISRNKNMKFFEFFKKIAALDKKQISIEKLNRNTKILERFFEQLKNSSTETKKYFLIGGIKSYG